MDSTSSQTSQCDDIKPKLEKDLNDAKLLYNSEKYEEGKDLLIKVVPSPLAGLTSTNPNVNIYISILELLSKMYEKLNDCNYSILFLEKELELLKPQPMSNDKLMKLSDLYFRLGKLTLINSNDLKKSNELFNNAQLCISVQHGHSSAEYAYILIQIGTILESKHYDSIAIEYFESAIEILKKFYENHDDISNLEYRIGLLLFNDSVTDPTNLLKARQLFENVLKFHKYWLEKNINDYCLVIENRKIKIDRNMKYIEKILNLLSEIDIMEGKLSDALEKLEELYKEYKYSNCDVTKNKIDAIKKSIKSKEEEEQSKIFKEEQSKVLNVVGVIAIVCIVGATYLFISRK